MVADSALDTLVRRQFGVSYDQFLEYFARQQIATFIQMGILAVLIWDWVTTLKGEIRSFWKADARSRLSVSQILFMINRYFPIFGFCVHIYWRLARSPSNPLCELENITTYVTIPMYATVEIIQMTRVWSLYNRSKPIGILLCIMFAAGCGGTAAVRTIRVPDSVPLAVLPPASLTGCPNETPKGFLECILALVNETIILGLLVAKVLKHVGDTPLHDALLMNGVAYYLATGMGFVLNIIGSMSNMLYYPVVTTDISICIGIIACNHLMLSLRDVRDRTTAKQDRSHALSEDPTSKLPGVTFAYTLPERSMVFLPSNSNSRRESFSYEHKLSLMPEPWRGQGDEKNQSTRYSASTSSSAASFWV